MSKFQNILSKLDAHIFEVLSGAALAFVLRGFGAGLAFVLNVMIARLLGAEGAGLYFMALSVTMFLSVVARMGLDNTILRFISLNASRGDWGQVKGVQSLGWKLAGSASLGFALLCFLLAPQISIYVFNEPNLTDPLRWMSLGIFTFSVMSLMSESLKGLKRIQNSMMVSGVLYPAFALTLIWPLVALMGVAGASFSYVLSTGLAAVLGAVFWRKAISQHDSPSISFSRETLWASSRPLWVMTIVNRAIMPWAPLFLLGIWRSAEEVGIFGAALRVSMLVAFFLMAVNTVLAPKFAELYDKKEFEMLGKLVRRFALAITLATSPFLFILVFEGAWVMRLFGSEFSRGGNTLAILALGQAVNTLTGSVGYLLMMTGHEKDVRNSALFGGVLVIGLSIVLIPSMGIIGAAIASAFAICGSNIVSVYFVKRRLGVMAVPFLRSR